MKKRNSPAYDSLRQAASATKIPLAVLKESKTRGCSAFRHGRVYEPELLKWLKQNYSENWSHHTQLENLILRLDHTQLAIRNCVDDSKFLNVDQRLLIQCLCRGVLEIVEHMFDLMEPEKNLENVVARR